MNDSNYTLKNFAGIALSTGLAILTSAASGGSGVFMGVVSGIAGNLASNYIDKTEFRQLKELLIKSPPTELNHDLKKLVIKAVESAVRNIVLLYKRRLVNKLHVKELEKVNGILLSEVGLLKTTLNASDEEIRTTIEIPKSSDQVFKLFDFIIDSLPEIQKDDPFNIFFKEHFLDNLQLYFGELLKSKRHHEAYVAYQREVYRKLDQSIEKLYLQNEIILKNLKDLKKKKEILHTNHSLKSIRGKIRTIDVNNKASDFELVFNRTVDELRAQTDILLTVSEIIKEDLTDIKKLSLDFSEALNKNWFSKHKVWTISIVGALVLIIFIMLFLFKQQPFSMVIQFTPGSIVDKSYPALSSEASFRISLSKGTKTSQISSELESVIPEIPGKLMGSKSKVILIDPYWKLTTDSLLIEDGKLTLQIIPNEVLSTIRGRLLSRDGQDLIRGAIVQMEDLIAYSDSSGIFELKVPVERRKMYYELRIEKDGFSPFETEYIAGSDMEIRLEKL